MNAHKTGFFDQVLHSIYAGDISPDDLEQLESSITALKTIRARKPDPKPAQHKGVTPIHGPLNYADALLQVDLGGLDLPITDADRREWLKVLKAVEDDHADLVFLSELLDGRVRVIMSIHGSVQNADYLCGGSLFLSQVPHVLSSMRMKYRCLNRLGRDNKSTRLVHHVPQPALA